ncbi:MAG: diaminopimelate decarboxylase [Euryarchaeota archaeon]|nr:diaminopimelate decarboxylase [Euryarchaeota archaeon]MDE1835043.1 diaminopimelate decarboxylase [Euryarchaeota archaeon]MDE1879314.1 diaminopimelate decarboxylase [Euryarchaeota archaeon]MDE2044882.1 diaminopimelate decarboxylase [Thermoplasmata archaeon]
MRRAISPWGDERELPAPFAAEGAELTLEGLSVRELAERFGTPLYVTSEARLRSNARRLRHAFETSWEPFRLLYAVKANNNPEIVRALRSEGCGADCSSPAEIEIARRAGVPASKILYTSVFPREDELAFAVRAGTAVNLDDPALLPRLLSHGTPRALSFRLNPGPTESGPEGLRFSGESKFGTKLSRALAAYRTARRSGIHELGMHTMPGSNILNPEHFRLVARFLGRSARVLRRATGASPSFLDMGGGLGVPYRSHELPLDLEAVARGVARELEGSVDRSCELWTEPGRYLMADTTVLLTRVTHRKEGRVPFVGVDAGMQTLLRPALYGAYHPMYAATQLGERPARPVHVVGPVCENTDVLARSRRLPALAAGDLLAIGNAGAYGFSMSSQYNTRPRPAEVLVRDGHAVLVRRRETLEDLWSHTGVWEPSPSELSRAAASAPGALAGPTGS